MLRALVDDQQRLVDPLLLVGLHELLRRRHERRGVAGLLDGELLRPAHGIGHLGILREAGQGELLEHRPLDVVSGRHC
jgi:hypothetical protein